MTTPVIFRKWKPRPEYAEEGGDIIALFPTELGTNDPYTCSSYQHVGQHGSAEPLGVIQGTKLAKPSEYADLLKELKGIGYDDLKVYQRYQDDFLAERKRKLAEIASPSRQVLPSSVTGPTSLKKWAKSKQKGKSTRRGSSGSSPIMGGIR